MDNKGELRLTAVEWGMGTKKRDVKKGESVNTKANQKLSREIVSFLPSFFFPFLFFS